MHGTISTDDSRVKDQSKFPDMGELDRLANLPIWIVWREKIDPDKPEARPKKPPYSPRTGWACDVTDPSQPGTRSQARSRMRRMRIEPGSTGGIGMVLGDHGDGLTRFGIDLDTCRDPATGTIDRWAETIIRVVPTYAEVSPSGTGMKLFGFVRTEHVPALREALGGAYGNKWTRGEGEHAAGVEFYAGKRYFTVTGQWDLAHGLNEVDPAVLLDLIRVQNAQGGGGEKAGAGNRAGRDNSRSGFAYRFAILYQRRGEPKNEWIKAGEDGAGGPEVADWLNEKLDFEAGKEGEAEVDRTWESAGAFIKREDEAASGRFPVEDPETDPPKSKPGLPLLGLDAIDSVLHARDFVQDVLGEGGASVVYGDSNVGKTFLATDLALHVAAGRPWCGRRVNQGGVVYCVLEGGNGFRNRVVAWRDAFGPESSAPFAAIPASLDLCRPNADTPRLIEAIKAAAEKIGQPVRLVVVDTLSRALAGGNENASEDMGALVRNMDRIRAETGVHVMFVHHCGKDAARGMRGWSGVRAAIDTEIEVVADETTGERTATVVKQRDMAKGAAFGFRLERVVLGQNQYGEDVTTCLVRHDQAAARQKAPRLPPIEQAMLGVLEKMGGDLPGGRFGMNEEAWRQACCEDRAVTAAPKPKSRQDAVSRAVRMLARKHRIEVRDGMVFLPCPWDPTDAFEAEEGDKT